MKPKSKNGYLWAPKLKTESILDENLSEAEGAAWRAFKVVTINFFSLQGRKLQAIC
jgi:hypothetical protein